MEIRLVKGVAFFAVAACLCPVPAAFTQGGSGGTYDGVAAEPQNETEMGLTLER